MVTVDYIAYIKEPLTISKVQFDIVNYEPPKT